MDLRVDLGSDPGAMDSSNPPSQWATVEPGRLTPSELLKTPKSAVTQPVQTAMSAVSDAATVPMVGCSGYWTENWKYGVSEAFANTWSWTGALVTFYESISTSHTLGIVAQSTSGSLTQGGTMNFSISGGSARTAPGLWDNQVNNQVNYRQQFLSCVPGWTWYPVSTASLLYPILGWSHSLHPIWTTCAVYANGTAEKSSGTNVTMGTGVSFPGLSVSAQSGWTTSVKETLNFAQNSRLCGSTSQGWVTSPQVEAHQA